MNVKTSYLSVDGQEHLSTPRSVVSKNPMGCNCNCNDHNNRAVWLARIRWVVIAIVMIIMASILLADYSSKTKNITVHTDIIAHTTCIDTPYFYFIVKSLSATNFSVQGIGTQNNARYKWKTFNASNNSNFSYETCCDHKWAVVYLPHCFQSLNTSQMLIIPPKHGKGSSIHKGDTLYIYLQVTDNHTEPREYPGIFWNVDSVEDGIIKSLKKTDNNITDAIQQRFNDSPVLHHEFSAYNSYTMSSLEVTYEINSWDEPWFGDKVEKIDNTYYTANVKTSIPHWVNTSNFIQKNDFSFYINPTGAGIETNITKEKDQYLPETFGKIGGYFGPLVSSTSILLTIAIFGLPAFCSGAPLFGGFAPNAGLSEIEQKQIRQYLIKLGVEMENIGNKSFKT